MNYPPYVSDEDYEEERARLVEERHMRSLRERVIRAEGELDAIKISQEKLYELGSYKPIYISSTPKRTELQERMVRRMDANGQVEMTHAEYQQFVAEQQEKERYEKAKQQRLAREAKSLAEAARMEYDAERTNQRSAQWRGRVAHCAVCTKPIFATPSVQIAEEYVVCSMDCKLQIPRPTQAVMILRDEPYDEVDGENYVRASLGLPLVDEPEPIDDDLLWYLEEPDPRGDWAVTGHERQCACGGGWAKEPVDCSKTRDLTDHHWCGAMCGDRECES